MTPIRARHLLLPVLLALLALGGCNSTPERIVTAQGLAPGTKIAVLPINFLPKASARIYNNALKFAGTAGRIAVTKADDSTRRKLTEGLAKERFRYQDHYQSLLLTSLREAGFEVELIDFSRSIDNVLGAVPPRRFEKRYPQPEGFDVLLDIYVEYVGYAADDLTKPYRPTVHIAARVVGAREHDVRYQSRIHFHPIGSSEDVVGISAEDAGSYDDVDDVLADIPNVRIGIERGSDAVIDKLVEELSR